MQTTYPPGPAPHTHWPPSAASVPPRQSAHPSSSCGQGQPCVARAGAALHPAQPGMFARVSELCVCVRARMHTKAAAGARGTHVSQCHVEGYGAGAHAHAHNGSWAGHASVHRPSAPSSKGLAPTALIVMCLGSCGARPAPTVMRLGSWGARPAPIVRCALTMVLCTLAVVVPPFLQPQCNNAAHRHRKPPTATTTEATCPHLCLASMQQRNTGTAASCGLLHPIRARVLACRHTQARKHQRRLFPLPTLP